MTVRCGNVIGVKWVRSDRVFSCDTSSKGVLEAIMACNNVRLSPNHPPSFQSPFPPDPYFEMLVLQSRPMHHSNVGAITRVMTGTDKVPARGWPFRRLLVLEDVHHLLALIF